MTVVIAIRDPDASNEFVTFGAEITIVNVDYGYADLYDEEEFSEWAESHADTAVTLYAVGEIDAARYLEGLIEEARDNFKHTKES